MLRTLILLAAALMVFAGGGELLAQDAWPASSGSQVGGRGTGFYFEIWKLVLLVLLVWVWVKSADWVGRDTDEIGDSIGMPGRIWNPIMVFTPLIAFFWQLQFPCFWPGWARCCCFMRRRL
jgi:hypothetical protein